MTLHKPLRLYLDPSVGIDFFWPNSIVAIALTEACDGNVLLTKRDSCDLAVFGPYPTGTRSTADKVKARLFSNREHKHLRLYVTMENTRPDFSRYDFCIGPDLGVENDTFLRLPYWMYVLGWPCLTQRNVTYSRYGRLLSIDRLMEPLGANFLSRNQKVVVMCKHLAEPRRSLYEAIRKQIEVDGFGNAFDSSVAHHNKSGVVKSEILAEYTFNLCPENSMHPGYYTEKIPEAFHAGCLPLSWTDPLVSCDFNPNAFVNFYQPCGASFEKMAVRLSNREFVTEYSQQPLLLKRPSLDSLWAFSKRIAEAATC